MYFLTLKHEIFLQGIKLLKTVTILAGLLITFTPGYAQSDSTPTSDPNTLLTVYLDCRGCNSSFIRSEIDFINFVRDQSAAEVHLIITRNGTASGGTQYRLNYLGQDDLEALSNEFIFTSYDSDTAEEERNGLVRYIKLGFIPFLSHKDALQSFDILYSGTDNTTAQQLQTDKWNSWIFEIGGNTWFSGEETQRNLNMNGRVRVRRITDEWKFQLNLDENYSRNTYTTTDDETGVTDEEVYITERRNVFSLLAYSLSDHWSVGSYFSLGSSSRDNIDFRIGGTPTIEYSFYPYREFARREVTLRYGVYSSFFDYTDRTIYGQTDEVLMRQELDFRAEYTKPCGSVEARILGRNYLHDFSKKRLLFDFEMAKRIVRGFDVFFSVGYSIINDQLSISAEGVTDKEAIANTRQQLTSYEYWGSVGFEITFGSIYDNVVNTRL